LEEAIAMSESQRLEVHLRGDGAPENAEWEHVVQRASERRVARSVSRRRLAVALRASFRK
jgi:hypothetical protein